MRLRGKHTPVRPDQGDATYEALTGHESRGPIDWGFGCLMFVLGICVGGLIMMIGIIWALTAMFEQPP